ncbi:MAG: DUF58 domain-containing protein [Dehalococcoidia bacterium]
MLRDAWPLLAIGAIVGGVVAGSVSVVALGLLVGAACYGATLWARWSLRRLSYERVMPEDHVFPGEHIALRLRITNDKPLPLTWIEATERFGPGVVVVDEPNFRPGTSTGAGLSDWRTSVRSHQRVSRTYELMCAERGVYEIGGVRLRSGDPLGLFTDDRVEERRARVTVYPRTAPLGDLSLPSIRPYGEAAGGARIFEDPSRIVGVRDYRPGDSLRRIDWKATARLGVMQSRVYDPSASRHLLLCLNTQTTDPAWAGVVTELLERSITVAASIARDAYEERYSVGLLANSTFPDADRSIRIPPGRRAEQFIRILEALAVVTPFVLEPLSAMLDREEHRLVAGTTVAVVTGMMTDELASAIVRLRRRGHTMVVLSTSGETWPERLGDVDVRDLSRVDAPWRAAATEGAT